MFLLLINLSFILLVSTATIPDENQATILVYENNSDGKGNYKFRYETSNNIKREETGTLVNEGQSDEHIEVIGFYSYIKPNGELEYVHYKADENGFSKYFPPPSAPSFASAGPLVASLLGK